MVRLAQFRRQLGSHKTSQRELSSNVVVRLYNRFLSAVRDQDIFGQPIPLTYDGSDTFKTFPGGVLSILVFLCMLFYFVLKLKYMINKEEWKLIQQEVLSTPEELKLPLDFRDFSNVSIGLQFQKKKGKISADNYWEEIKKQEKGSNVNNTETLAEDLSKLKIVSRYLDVLGMFELKSGQNYKMFNKINRNFLAWKRYERNLTLNEHDMFELKFNLSDAHLFGSGDSNEKMDEVINRYRLQFNLVQLRMDVLALCHQQDSCAAVMNELSDSQIYNFKQGLIYKKKSDSQLNNTEWQELSKESEQLSE